MADSAWQARADGHPGPEMAHCLRAATAAPSIHNSQPWLFRPHGIAVDVLADRRQHLAVADPDGREMHVSVGAALFNLRAAMLARGRQPLVRLLPDPDRPDLVATVTAGPAAPITPEARALADAIAVRRTNRRPFGSTPVPDPVIAALLGAAAAEGGMLEVVDPDTRGAVLSLERTAAQRHRSDPRYRAELAAWTTPAPGRDDGVPATAFGPRPELVAIPVRDFDLDHTTDRRVARFEREPTIALLATAGDTRRDWLLAGQALERVLLTATAHGLATMPLTQAVEVPELRRLLGAPEGVQVTQSVIRLGYAGRTPGTPRRPLADVLVRP